MSSEEIDPSPPLADSPAAPPPQDVLPDNPPPRPKVWLYPSFLQGLGPDAGFVKLVIVTCIVLYMATLALHLKGIGMRGTLAFLSPSTESIFFVGATGAIPVFRFGRWWTVLSSAWLHGSLLHITFNLLWVRDLAPVVAHGYGASRLVIIYTVAAIVGSALSSTAGQYLTQVPDLLRGAELALGASGAIFGLFGALVAYGQMTQNVAIAKKAFKYAVALFAFGFIIPRVDNWAHFGGFLGGYAVTKLPGLDPRFPETRGHFWVAIACLIATLASIIASIGHGLLLFNLAP